MTGDPGQDIIISDDPDTSRYEIHVDGALAGFSQYERRADRIVFTHTEIEPAFEGRGIGSALAQAVLDAAREGHLVVVPLCPFIRAYIDRHPEYLELVDVLHRGQGRGTTIE